MKILVIIWLVTLGISYWLGKIKLNDIDKPVVAILTLYTYALLGAITVIFLFVKLIVWLFS